MFRGEESQLAAWIGFFFGGADGLGGIASLPAWALPVECSLLSTLFGDMTRQLGPEKRYALVVEGNVFNPGLLHAMPKQSSQHSSHLCLIFPFRKSMCSLPNIQDMY